jgi:hypothetical protein
MLKFALTFRSRSLNTSNSFIHQLPLVSLTILFPTDCSRRNKLVAEYGLVFSVVCVLIQCLHYFQQCNKLVKGNIEVLCEILIGFHKGRFF